MPRAGSPNELPARGLTPLPLPPEDRDAVAPAAAQAVDAAGERRAEASPARVPDLARCEAARAPHLVGEPQLVLTCPLQSGVGVELDHRVLLSESGLRRAGRGARSPLAVTCYEVPRGPWSRWRTATIPVPTTARSASAPAPIPAPMPASSHANPVDE